MRIEDLRSISLIFHLQNNHFVKSRRLGGQDFLNFLKICTYIVISTIQIEYGSLGVQTNMILAVMAYSYFAANPLAENINILFLPLIACVVYSVQGVNQLNHNINL